MQCPRCGAELPNGSAHCFNCGALVAEPPPTVNEAQAQKGFAPLAGEAPYVESGWAEFSGLQYPDATPADVGAAPTVVSPPSGGASSPGYYPPSGGTGSPGYYPPPGDIPSGYYPYGPVPPGYAPPVASPSTRRRPRLALVVGLGVLVLLLIFGGVFLGISIGQSHNGIVQATATTATSPSSDPAHLYQQVTSQSPTFTDSLQNATTNTWAVYEKPTYGCHIGSDGLHLYIKDTGHFAYCTSGQGEFSNFALQVDMKILSGAGGGFVFRVVPSTYSLYYFHVYPDGNYIIYVERGNSLPTRLNDGTIGWMATGFGAENMLTVIAQGSQFYFYVNHRFLTKVQDSTYSKGYIGMSVSDLTGPTEVVYTNARIWSL
jgi:hypothetical protein